VTSNSRRLRPGQARPLVKRDPYARYAPEIEEQMMKLHALIDGEADERALEEARRALKC
jgi:hypothetical protein